LGDKDQTTKENFSNFLKKHSREKLDGLMFRMLFYWFKLKKLLNV